MATQKQIDKERAERYSKKLEVASSSTAISPFETPAEKALRIERAKSDVGFFVRTYLPHYATVDSASFQIEFAEAVKADPLFKGFAEWGRGLAKSVWCNVMIPLWLSINDETSYMVLVSDTETRATDLLDDLKVELEANPLFIHDFGEQQQLGHWESGNFTTKSGFTAKAFGIRQKVRGLRVGQRRPDLCVIDDIESEETVKNPKRMFAQAKWIESSLLPTMIRKYRRLLYANNRFARIMTQTILQEKHPHWQVHHVKAYDQATYKPAWEAMYTPEFYQQQELDMGVTSAWAEYNQVNKVEGKVFKEEQIQWCELPDLLDFKMIVAHWDIAYTDNETSDYNAIRVWGLKDRKFYLIDCYVKQSIMKRAVEWLAFFKKGLPEGVNIILQYESQFWNGEVQRSIDEVETEQNVDLNLMKVKTPTTNKLMRMITMQPYYQNSRVYYNEALKSHTDTQIGILQLCGVEEGSSEHDDAPDSDKQCFSSLEAYDTPTRKPTDGKSYRTGKMKQSYKW